MILTVAGKRKEVAAGTTVAELIKIENVETLQPDSWYHYVSYHDTFYITCLATIGLSLT